MGIGSNLYAGSSAVGKLNSYVCVCITSMVVCSLLVFAAVSLLGKGDFKSKDGKRRTDKRVVAVATVSVACCLCCCAGVYYWVAHNTKHGAALVGASALFGAVSH